MPKSPILVAPDLIFDSLSNRIFVFVHSAYAPRDNDFFQVTDYISKFGEGLSKACVIVLTDGGGPTAQQRAKMKQLNVGTVKGTRTALVTDSSIVRFIGTSVALLTKTELKTFAADEFSKALTFLQLAAAEERELLDWLRAAAEFPEAKMHFGTLAKLVKHFDKGGASRTTN